ncbi:hypothetical protein LCGC14_2400840 [marine sediment metagenome]|uniref:DNA-formamidopyrimidine glycosylase n=1 Tax=marine sediment metagenome TaxID=412755 RepID=A0A0F9CHH9_9ZZZZ
MPEIPDLEGYRAYFSKRLPGVRVSQAAVIIPIVVRASREQFTEALTGETLGEVRRQGKYLLFPFRGGRLMVVHAMLTGRFQYCDPGQKRRARTAFVLALDNAMELRYFDQRLMGKVYLVREEGELSAAVPRWSEMGPDVLSRELTEELFVQRLKKYRGQIKNVLTKEQCVAGIGNAYAPADVTTAMEYSFQDSAAAVVTTKAIPVIAEIDETLTIDPADVERKITPRTKAIVPVHMGGMCCIYEHVFELELNGEPANQDLRV